MFTTMTSSKNYQNSTHRHIYKDGLSTWVRFMSTVPDSSWLYLLSEFFRRNFIEKHGELPNPRLFSSHPGQETLGRVFMDCDKSPVYGGFQEWAYPKMDGSKWKIQLKQMF